MVSGTNLTSTHGPIRLGRVGGGQGAFYYHAWPEVYIDEGNMFGPWLGGLQPNAPTSGEWRWVTQEPFGAFTGGDARAMHAAIDVDQHVHRIAGGVYVGREQDRTHHDDRDPEHPEPRVRDRTVRDPRAASSIPSTKGVL